MNRSPWLLLAACFILIPLAGCATMESSRSSKAESTYSAKSKSREQETADSDADEDDDDPRKYVGDERRDGLVTEEPLDPWFGKYNYADKGRAIERNLGSKN